MEGDVSSCPVVESDTVWITQDFAGFDCGEFMLVL